MPYINKVQRALLDAREEYPETTGELNYVITQVVVDYLDRNGTHYQTFNDIIGALESAKLEFYARVVRPYEDQKKKTNGDVYV